MSKALSVDLRERVVAAVAVGASCLPRRGGAVWRQPDLDPNHLVFIDETWASTKMPRTMSRHPSLPLSPAAANQPAAA
jgi:hypothetical protein